MTRHVVETPSPEAVAEVVRGEGNAAFYRIGEQAFGGWIRDPARPETRFVVDIRVDGENACLTLAESFVPEVRRRFGGDGCHGFVVLIDAARLEGADLVEAYVANTTIRLGSVSLRGTGEALPVATGRVAGELRWAGGLRLTGWACDVASPGIPLPVEILVDGELLVQALPTRWRESQPGDVVPSGRTMFDACLPGRFADGRTHTVRALAGGVDLAGSPTLVLVHDQGFEGLAQELDPEDRTGHLLRTQFLDRLMPAAVPLGEFEAWRARFPVSPPPRTQALMAVLIIGDDEGPLERTVASLEAQSHADWFAVCLSASDGFFGPEALAGAAREIDEGGADGIVVVEVGATLDPHALGHLATALASSAFPGLIYSDAVLTAPGGRLVPSFKPAFDRHRLQAQAYAADLFAVPRARLANFLAAGPRSVYDLLFAAVRRCEGAGEPIGHLPQLLVVCPARDAAARGGLLADAVRIDGEARACPRPAEPLPGLLGPVLSLGWPARLKPDPVSIIIPTRDRVDLLEPCLESLFRLTEGIEFEVIVVDNGSREPATHQLFDRVAGLGVRVLPADGPFNYSRLNNLAVAEARHPLVCLLNNDIEVVEPGWLRAMALELTDPAVGAVGATLLWPSRLVQHGGVVLGPHLAAAHAFNDRLDGEGGFDDQLLVPRSQSAVTAACLLLRRADYEALGGLDETTFPVSFNDVDLCLRLREAGRTVLLTPRARLLHKESASRGQDLTLEKRSRARKELMALRERWAPVLAADPFYNPNLSLDLYPFSGLATPPRDRGLRFADNPKG